MFYAPGTAAVTPVVTAAVTPVVTSAVTALPLLLRRYCSTVTIDHSCDCRRCRRTCLCCACPEYVIEGVNHNVPFLRDVVRNRDFAEGQYSTAFIGQHYPDGWVKR